MESLEAIYDNDFRLSDDTRRHSVNITIRSDNNSSDHEYTLVPLLTTELQVCMYVHVSDQLWYTVPQVSVVNDT